jgi:hypothetical protein
MEKLMKDDEAARNRLDRRDVRHGLAQPPQNEDDGGIIEADEEEPGPSTAAGGEGGRHPEVGEPRSGADTRSEGEDHGGGNEPNEDLEEDTEASRKRMDERLARLRQQAAGAARLRREDGHDEEARRGKQDREDGDQGRSTRRRSEGSGGRGVRRDRDDAADEEEQERGRTWRRVGAINAAINDIINIKHNYTKQFGRRSDDKCDRETARMMIEELDKKFERRLKQFQDRERNAGATKPKKGKEKGTVAEAYSPPRMTAVAAEFGLDPLWSMDMTTYDEEDGEEETNDGEAFQAAGGANVSRRRRSLVSCSFCRFLVFFHSFFFTFFFYAFLFLG